MLAVRRVEDCQEASGRLVGREDMRLEGMRAAAEGRDHETRAVEEEVVGRMPRRAAAGARPAVAKRYALERMLAIVPRRA